MLPKSGRLNLSKQFKWVASGQKIDTSNFRLFLRLGENLRPLVGIALSTKYFRKSVGRHRAKRLASQAIESLYSGLSNDLNLVIMPKGGVLGQSSSQLMEEIKQALQLCLK